MAFLARDIMERMDYVVIINAAAGEEEELVLPGAMGTMYVTLQILATQMGEMDCSQISRVSRLGTRGE